MRPEVLVPVRLGVGVPVRPEVRVPVLPGVGVPVRPEVGVPVWPGVGVPVPNGYQDPKVPVPTTHYPLIMLPVSDLPLHKCSFDVMPSRSGFPAGALTKRGF